MLFSSGPRPVIIIIIIIIIIKSLSSPTLEQTNISLSTGAVIRGITHANVIPVPCCYPFLSRNRRRGRVLAANPYKAICGFALEFSTVWI